LLEAWTRTLRIAGLKQVTRAEWGIVTAVSWLPRNPEWVAGVSGIRVSRGVRLPREILILLSAPDPGAIAAASASRDRGSRALIRGTR